MARFDRYGYETSHSKYCRVIWSSDTISTEDKEWVDSISNKSNIKLSDQERLERLYEETTGIHEDYEG